MRWLLGYKLKESNKYALIATTSTISDVFV